MTVLVNRVPALITTQWASHKLENSLDCVSEEVVCECVCVCVWGGSFGELDSLVAELFSIVDLRTPSL